MYRPHQIAGGEWALATVRKHGFAYIHWQERCGKSGAAIHCIENSAAKTCLIVTKKKAISGWEDSIAMFDTKKDYTITNYESVHKVIGSFDFIILDEAHHAISGKPKVGKVWRAVAKYTKNKPIIYLSATGYSENMGLIYHQLKLSSWTPFKYKNFYLWFKTYGIEHKTRTPYGLVETYSKYHDEQILEILKPYFNFKTREEVGIEHEPSVNVVKVPLKQGTKDFIAKMTRDEMLGDIPLDSPMKLRSKHYMVEQGVINEAYDLG